MTYRDRFTGPGVVNPVGTPEGAGQYTTRPAKQTSPIASRASCATRSAPGSCRRRGLARRRRGAGRPAGTARRRSSTPRRSCRNGATPSLEGAKDRRPRAGRCSPPPSPEAAWLLDHATDVARALEQGPERHGGESTIAGPLATTAIAEHAMSTLGALGSGIGGAATAYALERPGTIRALAGRPAPYFKQISSLPALMAVAQAQGRNLGY